MATAWLWLRRGIPSSRIQNMLEPSRTYVSPLPNSTSFLPLVSNKYFHVDFSLWFPAPRNRRDVTSWNFWDMIARCWASLLRTLQCTHYSIDLGWSMHLKLDAVRGSRWKRKHFCHVCLKAWEGVNIKYQQSQKLDCENGSPPFQTLIQGPSGTQWNFELERSSMIMA